MPIVEKKEKKEKKNLCSLLQMCLVVSSQDSRQQDTAANLSGGKKRNCADPSQPLGYWKSAALDIGRAIRGRCPSHQKGSLCGQSRIDSPHRAQFATTGHLQQVEHSPPKDAYTRRHTLSRGTFVQNSDTATLLIARSPWWIPVRKKTPTNYRTDIDKLRHTTFIIM